MRRPIRVVLDASAVTAWLVGSEHVGEVIAEVHDEHAAFGLPVACLAKGAAGGDDNLVRLLVGHPAATVLPVPADYWPALTATVSVLRQVTRASALVAAEQHGAWVVTAEPEAFKVLGDDPPVIAV